jgi:hypothetical protein
MGPDGALLLWLRFETGVREFCDTTLPLVKRAGLCDLGGGFNGCRDWRPA